MSKNKELTYSQALKELEKIVKEIESEEVDVDILAERIKRASQILTFCRDKLRTAEDEVKKVLTEMGDESETGTADKEEDPF
ncbi:MAG: exodeoxyribonuclease VII small subunit [Nitrospirota bacterium]|nr:exodeoxyribonuclease VII small subunit [Nitrospirota bacterium]